MISTNRFKPTRLIHAPDNWTIDGLPAGRLPIAVNNREGTPFLVQSFLLREGVRFAAAWRTVEKKAHILCAWWDYLFLRKTAINCADEDDLVKFLLGNGKRYSNISPLPDNELELSKTNGFRFNTILDFHKFIEVEHHIPGAVKYGYTLGALRDSLENRSHRFKFSRTGETKAPPSTPSQEDAQRVIDAMLEIGNAYRAQTFYLIGSLAKGGGFRAGGVASLTVRSMISSLAGEAAIRKVPDYKLVLKEFRKPLNRRTITQSLQKMKSEKRKFIFCNTRMKGGNIKPTPIPIDTYIEILDYICNEREFFAQNIMKKQKRRVPDNVFLSGNFKAGDGAYKSESISNIYNRAFKELGVAGSYHRLRATFAVEIVSDLYLRERALNGRAWQANNVLETARQLLNHKTTKTLDSYLSDIIAQELALLGEPIVVGDPKDAAQVRGLVDAIALDAELNSRFYKWCESEKIAALEEPFRRKKPL